MLKDHEFESIYQTALRAVAQTSELLRRHWRPRQTMAYDTKLDATPVTEVDRAVEQRIREIVRSRHPDHAIIGEEHGGAEPTETPWLWVIDPIDGTKSYIRGLPHFGTQLAVLYQGKVVIGVSNAPALGEMAVTRRGGGAFVNNRPLRVSKTKSLKQALVAHGELQLFERRRLLTGVRALCRTAWGIHGFQTATIRRTPRSRLRRGSCEELNASMSTTCWRSD